MKRDAPMQIVLSATFTANPLTDVLRFWMAELGWSGRVRTAPYGQVFQTLLDPDGLFAQNRDGANVVLFRFDDWRSETVAHVVADFLTQLREAAQRWSVPGVVCLCPDAPNSPADRTRLIQELQTQLADAPNLTLLLPEEIAAQRPTADYYDAQGDANGHLPYTPDYFAALGTALMRKIAAWRRPPLKVIVSDCDNTLWGGVCGEVGAAGVAFEPAHRALQSLLIEQGGAGRLLCLNSKNVEADVWRVFTERAEEMPLQREHLTAWRINWQAKSANLRELAAELQLGLDSFLFIDDNPFECAEVAANCPGVQTLRLPPDEAQWERLLRRYWLFDSPRLTTEDRRRAESYRQNREREALRQTASGWEEFLARLELEVEIAPAQPEQWERLAQLTQRVNQFNNTTRRYTVAELQSVCTAESVTCFAAQARDRFGDYGLCGLALAERQGDELQISSLALSCRALGRGVEHRLLASLAEFAQAQCADYLTIPFVPSERNAPMHAFLERLGGARTEAGYRLTLAQARAAAQLPILPDEAEETVQTSEKAPDISSGQMAPSADCWQRIAEDYADAQAIAAAVARFCARSRPERLGMALAPRSRVEETFVALWEETLNVQPVGVQDSFFDLGGDSLQSVRLLNRLAMRTGVTLPLNALFDAPTVADFARFLEACHPQAWRRLQAAPIEAETKTKAETEAHEVEAPHERGVIPTRLSPDTDVQALSDTEVSALLAQLLHEGNAIS